MEKTGDNATTCGDGGTPKGVPYDCATHRHSWHPPFGTVGTLGTLGTLSYCRVAGLGAASPSVMPSAHLIASKYICAMSRLSHVAASCANEE